MRLLLLFAALVLLAGCGYRPSSHYTVHVLGQNIYTEINIPVDNPETSLLIIDAVNEAVVSKFKARLTSKKEVSTHLLIKSATFATAGLQKDEQGFTVLYRTTATLNIELITETAKRNFAVSGIYDFAVTADSIISEEKRLASFRLATAKALDAITPVLASMGKAVRDKKVRAEMREAGSIAYPEAVLESNATLPDATH